MCGQSVCLADTVTNRRHHELLGQKALADTCVPVDIRDKKARPLSHDGSRKLRKNFILVLGSLSFRYAQIALPVRAHATGKLFFVLIYFISCLFYFNSYFLYHCFLFV